MKKYIGLLVMFFIISCTVWSDDMAFNKKSWQSSNFDEKIGEGESKSRMNDGVSWGTGSNLKVKVIDIGDWDMDLTTLVVVPHGLDDQKIRSVEVMIRNDVGGEIKNLIWGHSNFDTTPQGAIRRADSINIRLYRLDGGTFDVTTHNATSYNRGWITIWYES